MPDTAHTSQNDESESESESERLNRELLTRRIGKDRKDTT